MGSEEQDPVPDQAQGQLIRSMNGIYYGACKLLGYLCSPAVVVGHETKQNDDKDKPS